MSKRNISYTAWIVIRCLMALHESKRWRNLVPDDAAHFYARCIGYCGKHAASFRVRNLLPPACTALGVEAFLARGVIRHFALRKAAIATMVEEAVAGGAAQLVVLGGGFDLCAYRMASSHPELAVLEIDTPAMHPHKMNLLREAFGSVPNNFTGVPADLSVSRLNDVLLAQTSFDAAKPTVYVAEGLSMYLTHEAFTQLLERIRSLSAGRGHFIFTAVGTQQHTSNHLWRWLNEHMLAFLKENFNFVLNRDGIPAFLAANQFTLLRTLSYAELQQHVCSPDELRQLEKENGEYLVFAQF